jgi:hypothetical protein
MFKPHHEIVGVANGNDIAMRYLLPPYFQPQVEDVMQIEVGQQG